MSGQSLESFAQVVRTDFDLFVPIYATFLFIGLALVPFLFIVYKLVEKYRQKSREIPYREPSYKQYDEYTEDRGVTDSSRPNA